MMSKLIFKKLISYIYFEVISNFSKLLPSSLGFALKFSTTGIRQSVQLLARNSNIITKQKKKQKNKAKKQ